MTFYEAALRILEGEGRPLHVQEITEKSIAQNLLSHVGKLPEQTMLSRLAAMARRARDRRVVVTAKDTFALSDWSLPEDPEALAQTGIPEENPEESLPPLRPEERHPEPRSDNVRTLGRGGDRRRRHDEEEGKGGRRRFPPIAEVMFEGLSDAAEPLTPGQLVERAQQKGLASRDLNKEMVLRAVAEDNQRRIDSGRQPQFFLIEEPGQTAMLGLVERSGAAHASSPAEIQAAFGRALGVPFENGQPVWGKLSAAVDPAVESAVKALKGAAKEARRATAKAFAARLAALDLPAFERAVIKALHGLDFRELKVAKRSKEGPLLTARKREGSVELRYAVRVLKGQSTADRRTLQELRRDLGHYGAQLGLVVSASEARADAKSEAQAGGNALVLLWCGEALAERFFEARAGVSVTTVELYDVDERFFEQMRQEGAEQQRKRDERSDSRGDSSERGRRGGNRQEAPSREDKSNGAAVESASPESEAVSGSEGVEANAEAPDGTVERVSARMADEAEPTDEADDDGQDGEEGDEEGDTAEPGNSERAAGEEGAPTGERRRRRRRRRGRRGRGGAKPGEEGAAAAPAEGDPGATPAPVPVPGPSGEGGPQSGEGNGP